MTASRAEAYTLNWNKIRKSDLPRLGMKCFNLAQHKQGGAPIPPFFAIPNNRIAEVIRCGEIAPRLREAVMRRIVEMENETGKKLGERGDPLLVSVRSGDPRSMHGVLLSLMNIGLNDRTLTGLIKKYGPESRTEALWLYLNLIVDYARQVNNIERQTILPLLQRMKDKEAGPEALEAMIDEAQNLGRHYPVEFTFPQDVRQQLSLAIKAVANSWTSITAKCAAAAIGLGPTDMLSVFIQEMVFSMLTPDSAFVSFLTHPGMQGTYAPQISGRRVMSGTALGRTIRLDEFSKRADGQEAYRQITEISGRLVRKEKFPLNVELVFERSVPHVLQVSRADLSPVYHVRAINELVQSGIITEEDAVRERTDIIIKKQLKLHKLNPEAEFEEVAQGKGGGSGAMAGLLVFSPAQALELCKQNYRVILLSTEPQDENVYLLTLGKKLDGLIATYGVGRGSHIADLAMSNGIPLVLGLKGVEFPSPVSGPGEANEVLIQGRLFRKGEIVVIDGGPGRILVTPHPEPVIEDKQIESSMFGINIMELMHSIEVRFGGCSYQEILDEHAHEIKDLQNMPPLAEDRARISGLQERIHCLHLLARRIGQNMGKSLLQVDQDVEVADGSFDRIAGLEDKNFLIRDEGYQYLVITAGEVYYDFLSEYVAEGFTDTSELVEGGKKRGLDIMRFRGRRKLTIHSQELVFIGITFPREQLDAVIAFLKEHFKGKEAPPQS